MNDYCLKCMQPRNGRAVCPHCGHVGAYNSAPHMLQPGTILGNRYLIGEAIGQGGFGITYIGLDIKLRMRVAIKEYYPNGVANRSAKATNRIMVADDRQKQIIDAGKRHFLAEARALGGFLGVSGVVDVRDYFETNNTAYIIMEYLDGRDLRSYLETYRFTADGIFELMAPVINALERIHRAGIIHRDISPDNIMLLKDGTLKLMDFGAARNVNAEAISASIMLKHGYAPEEQYRSRGVQGPWTDVYALCATIYKCITGVTPDDALTRKQEDLMKWPSQMGIPIRPAQETALKRGMEIMADERIRSMAELRDVISGKALPPRKPRVTPGIETVRPSGKKNVSQETRSGTGAGLAIGIGAAVLVLLGGAVFAMYLGRTDRTQSEDALSDVFYASPAELTTDAGAVSSVEETAEPALSRTAEAEAVTPGSMPTPEPTPAVVDHAIIWGDAALETAMRGITGIPEGDIMLSDVYECDALDLSGYGIANISALRELTNLVELDLSNNSLTDISALRELTGLRVLFLGGNGLGNEALESLRELTQLNVLWLDENNITDISALDGLTGLEQLLLRRNDISSLEPISSMTRLSELSVSENAISDLQPLSGLRELTILYASYNAISDLTPLSEMALLTDLQLIGNEISDITSLSSLTRLRTLLLSDNHISDISALGGMTQLSALDLHNNPLLSLEPLAGIVSLTQLNLNNTGVVDIEPLSGLKRLTLLTISDNGGLRDIALLSSLTGLRELDLAYDDIGDLTPLYGLSGLEALYLEGNPVSESDIQALYEAIPGIEIIT